MTIILTKPAAGVAKLIRVFNFFKDTGIATPQGRAYLRGAIDALQWSGACGHEEARYLRQLLRDGAGHENTLVEDWEDCIAAPGYFPYETYLQELARLEMEGQPVTSLDAMPSGAYPSTPDGISFHKFDFYQHGPHRQVETDQPLIYDDRSMKLFTLDESVTAESHAADIAIAAIIMHARFPAGNPILGFETVKEDLTPEVLLEGVRRAKDFETRFPTTYMEREYDYRRYLEDDSHILDYHRLVIRQGGKDLIVREPLLDPLQSPY